MYWNSNIRLIVIVWFFFFPFELLTCETPPTHPSNNKFAYGARWQARENLMCIFVRKTRVPIAYSEHFVSDLFPTVVVLQTFAIISNDDTVAFIVQSRRPVSNSHLLAFKSVQRGALKKSWRKFWTSLSRIFDQLLLLKERALRTGWN